MLGSRTVVRLASPSVLRPCSRVCYSTKPFQVFDKGLKRVQRDRSASNVEQSREVDYLRDEIALRATERLAFVTKEFPRVLDLGSGPGNLERLICDPNTPDAELIRSRLGKITMVDSSEKMLNRDKDLEFNKILNLERVVEEEENLSTERFPPNSYDAVISNMTMHWINDLPGVLKRVQDILVPDGMFMASMLGGDSLFELRTSLQLAEMERRGGISPRVSPLADVRDMGALLQQAKFNLLTVDVDDIVVSYPDVFALMEDIQSMGESNATIVRAHSLPRDVLMATDSIYRSMHGEEDGSLPATFRIIYMIGWKPAPTQPKPLKRGSGEVNLKEALPQYADGEEQT